MRIRIPRLMLCLLASSGLIFSSCQKEENLLQDNAPIPAAAVQENHAEHDVCGAVLYGDDMAQSRMQTMEYRVQNFIRENPDAVNSGARTVIIIPVVFHVVYNLPEQNISTAQLQSQIDVLNEDFNAANADMSSIPSAFQPLIGNASIQFVLAARDPQGNATTGITRTYTTYTSFSSNGSVCFASTGGHNAWPASQYLNIWVCNKSGSAGYSAYPWSGNASTDGIIVKYTYVGRVGTFTNNWNYQKGRTITHEVGHWLGLVHIWGDAACGNDLVNDTPVQSAANGSCPSFPDLSTCSPNSNGDMYMNFMDYTYDACRTMFSSLQVTRMLGYLNVTRAGILTSLGAIPPTSTACNVPSGLSTSSITSSGATFNWASTGAASYNIRYKPVSSSVWTTTSSLVISKIITGLSASITYEFQVQSVCTSGSSAYSASSIFTTSGALSSCNVPTGLTATSVTSTNAILSWASTGAASYNIRYRKINSSSSWITVSSPTTSRVISWLIPGSTYEFQVRSICASGSSSYSSSTTFITAGN